jgi:para-nitrobenzyl esterase
VLALLASPAAAGLFGRAIAQSPALPLIADKSLRDQRAYRYLELLGVTDPSRLKVLPQRDLRRGAAKLQIESAADTPTLGYGLTYGTELLPYHPIEAARRGEVHHVPLIIGSNSHEASMFARIKPPMLPTTESTIDRFFSRVGPQHRDAVVASYPRFPARSALAGLGSDAMFAAPMWAFANAYSAYADTYMYRFDHTAWGLRLLGLGATHGSEIVHVHHSYGSFVGLLLSPLGSRMLPSVGRRMQRSWLGFATGDGPGDWPGYEIGTRSTRIIRSRADVTVEDPDGDRRAAWAPVH